MLVAGGGVLMLVPTRLTRIGEIVWIDLADDLFGVVAHAVKGVMERLTVSAPGSREDEQKRNQGLFQHPVHAGRKSAFDLIVKSRPHRRRLAVMGTDGNRCDCIELDQIETTRP